MGIAQLLVVFVSGSMQHCCHSMHDVYFVTIVLHYNPVSGGAATLYVYFVMIVLHYNPVSGGS